MQVIGQTDEAVFGHLLNARGDVSPSLAFYRARIELGSREPRLAEELNKRCEQIAKVMPILLEVNVSGEGSKHGFTPETAVEAMNSFFDFPQLELRGLMTMAPFTRQPESARPYFQKLREVKSACEDKLGAPLLELSMGMSGDFEIAIEEGATLIRLGTTLFGPRAQANKD